METSIHISYTKSHHKNTSDDSSAAVRMGSLQLHRITQVNLTGDAERQLDLGDSVCATDDLRVKTGKSHACCRKRGQLSPFGEGGQ